MWIYKVSFTVSRRDLCRRFLLRFLSHADLARYLSSRSLRIVAGDQSARHYFTDSVLIELVVISSTAMSFAHELELLL